MQEETKTYTPQIGDKVLCDPEYSIAQLKAKRQPNCVVPAEIISLHKNFIYVEILPPNKATGHKLFDNREAYGSTTYCLTQAVIKA